MNHELNARVAERVMGWKVHWYDGVPNYMRDGWVVLVPDFSGSLDAAWEMEEELERRGLCDEYEHALVTIAWSERLHPARSAWRLIHATPEQRCEAALEAVK